MAKVTLNVRVEESLRRRLEAAARAAGLDRSEVIRAFLHDGLDAVERGEKRLTSRRCVVVPEEKSGKKV